MVNKALSWQPMKNIIFYVEPDWAFGSVHHELAKRLRPYGFNCMVLAWNKSYTREEMIELDKVADLYVTTPHGWRFLGYDYQTVAPEKCAIVTHAKLDMTELIHYHGHDDFYQFKAYSCVSEWLRGVSKDLGINRDTALTPVAINYDLFRAEPPEKLTTLGYAGSFHSREEFSQNQIASNLAQPKYHKRGYLVKEIAEKLGLDFKIAQWYHNTYVTMPGYYRSIDCLIAPSTEEGAGLPVMEAGAAGRLVIGTSVGHWPQKIREYGGIEVPISEKEFVEQTCEHLNYYIAHPKEYREKCYAIREHARTYDWSYVIDSWVELLK